MFGSVILDVLVGLMIVYLLLSLVSSAIREAIADLFSTRARLLERGIVELLDGDMRLVAALYSHPQVAALYPGKYGDAAKTKRNLPSYIPSKNFALALLDIAARGRDISAVSESGGSATVMSLRTIRQQVARIESKPVQRMILTAVDTAQGDLGRAQKSIENWFDSSMDRVSGWYRRRTTWTLLAVGLVLSVALNADTLRIANRLYRDPVSRQAAIAMAESMTREPATTPGDTATNRRLVEQRQQIQLRVAQLDSLHLPIGWPDPIPAGSSEWWLRIVGWIVTAVAVSLGAPFWFDTLNRIMIIRSTVKPHEKSPEEASQDRQDHPPAPPAAQGQTAAAPSSAAMHGAPAASGVSPSYQPHEWSSGYPQGGLL